MTNNIYVYCWTAADGYCIKSYTSGGVYVNTIPVLEQHDWNNILAVDKDDNVYCVGSPATSNPDWRYIDTLTCYDKDGNLLYYFEGVIYDSLYAVCVGPDGYIYTLEYRAAWDEVRIVKRASGIVDVVESKKIAEPVLCQCFIMDSDKYIYMQSGTVTKVVKYNYGNDSPLPVIAYSTFTGYSQRTFAIVNGVLAIGDRGYSEIKTAKLDLSAYINESLDIPTMQAPIGIGNIGNDFILCGYNDINAIVGRYLSDGTKVWETIIGPDGTVPYQVAAYPFAVEFTGELFPFVPASFQYVPPESMLGMFYYRKPYPEKSMDELRRKCRVFLNNSVEEALVLNHNIRVLKAFVHDLGDFSAFRFMIPTQHLDELANRPLGLSDFKAIINDFINNSMNNAMNVNYNFKFIIRNGLADYFTDDDRAFTDIKVQSQAVITEEPDVEMLKRTVDALSAEVMSNHVVVHHNLQVVKAILT